MKIKSELKIREIAGEAIVLLPGKGGKDMTRVLALNASSQFLWESLKDKDFTSDDAVKLLLEKYDVAEEQARADVGKWIEQLNSLDVLE